MEAGQKTECWCPVCRRDHEEPVPADRRDGARWQGRLIRTCLACEVQQFHTTERKKGTSP